jgi:transcription elongation factor Elf1
MTAGRPQRAAEAPQLDAIPTTVLCPRCGREHKRVINWKGRGVPRLFCHNCERRLNCDRNSPGESYVKMSESFKSWLEQHREVRNCHCHDVPVYMCPTYRHNRQFYMIFREIELSSLQAGVQVWA